MQVKIFPDVITKSKVIAPDKDWEFIVKMTLIMRDILYGIRVLMSLDGMKRHWDEMQLPVVSRDRDSGQTGCQMPTLQRQF